MPTKPIKKASKAMIAGALLTPRERLWNTMRKLREFTVEQVQDATVPLVTLPTAQKYTRCLVNGGFLEVVRGQSQSKRGPFMPGIYKVAKDQLEPPRVNENGKPTGGHIAITQLAMWRAMQTLRTFEESELFDAVNLPATPERPAFVVTRRAVNAYRYELTRAGYLFEQRGKARAGGGQAPSMYRLVRNTGALPPMVTRQLVVIDRNTGTVHTHETAQEVVDGNS